MVENWAFCSIFAHWKLLTQNPIIYATDTLHCRRTPFHHKQYGGKHITITTHNGAFQGRADRWGSFYRNHRQQHHPIVARQKDRNFPLPFQQQPPITHHYAIIGIAHVANGYPLYYDAANEAGLCMAGLNFPGFARYLPIAEGKNNISSFEFIPWVLSQCGNMKEIRKLLPRLQLTDEAFSVQLPPSPLHWIIADQTECICIEPMADGIRIHDNPIGVLTNNPPFDYHMHNLKNYLNMF